MSEFIFSDQDKELLASLKVEALVLFGSRALGISRIGSDYDFGVLVKDKSILKSPEKRKMAYDGLYDLLSEKINQLVNIDIVFLEDAPAELQTHVAKYGIPIYQAALRVFPDFKEYVMITQADFEPYREMFQHAILSRL